MRATSFDLVTHWRFAAPRAAVWEALSYPEEWPRWWTAVRQVDIVHAGDRDGIGAVRRMTWTTALPYSLAFTMTTTRVEPRSLIEGEASGELDGTGRWTLRDDGPACLVRYDWRVRVTKPWMVLAAPAIRPVFAWNHRTVMAWGEAGLRDRLSAHLSAADGERR